MGWDVHSPVCSFNLALSCCLECGAPDALMDQDWAGPGNAGEESPKEPESVLVLLSYPGPRPWTPTSHFTLYETNSFWTFLFHAIDLQT